MLLDFSSSPIPSSVRAFVLRIYAEDETSTWVFEGGKANHLLRWDSPKPLPSMADLEAIYLSADDPAIVEVRDLGGPGDWNKLEDLLTVSPAYARIVARSDNQPGISLRVAQLMDLISTTRKRLRLQLVLDSVASTTGFTQADKADLNSILEQAEFSERVS